MNTPYSRLAAAFAKTAPRAALIPYLTAGEPSKQATPKLMHALVQAGADIIELGVPFSDPMADGPVIQRAGQRAIERGVGLKQVLEMVSEFRRQDDSTPVVLMGYANPVERMGQQNFVSAAAQAGVDGALVVDYPPEEMTEFADMLEKADVAPIFLLAPTSTEERIKKVAQIARGYVYYVSLKGITGAGNLDTRAVEQRLADIRRHVRVPVGVGFGIRDAQSAAQLGKFSDAVIIGSKLIETMEQAAELARQQGVSDQEQIDAQVIKAAADWMAGIREALN